MICNPPQITQTGVDKLQRFLLSTFEDIFVCYRSIYLTVMAVDTYHLEEAKEQVIEVLRAHIWATWGLFATS